MKKEKLIYFKGLLLERKKEVQDRIEHLNEICSGGYDADGSNSRYSFHMADDASDSIDREVAFLLQSREYKYLQQIERSLGAIDMGEYGKCRICGKEISEERLTVVPTTRTCLICKQRESNSQKLVRMEKKVTPDTENLSGYEDSYMDFLSTTR